MSYSEGDYFLPTVQIHLKTAAPDCLTWVNAPETELTVLELLGIEQLTAPQISRKSSGTLSSATVYTLLSRLKKRGLVERKEIPYEVQGVTLPRIVHYTTFDSLFNPMKPKS